MTAKRAVMWVEKNDLFQELTVHVLEKVLLLINVYEFLEEQIHSFVTDVSVGFRPPCWSSSR